jgi:hypothetical protein
MHPTEVRIPLGNPAIRFQRTSGFASHLYRWFAFFELKKTQGLIFQTPSLIAFSKTYAIIFDRNELMGE